MEKINKNTKKFDINDVIGVYFIGSLILGAFIMILGYGIEDIYSINKNDTSSYIRWCILWFLTVMSNLVLRVKIYSKYKENGRSTDNNFKKPTAIILSLVYGYMWCYIFTGIILVVSFIMETSYVINVVPHTFAFVLVGVVHAISFYYSRKIKNIEAEIDKEIQSEIINRSKSLSEGMQSGLSSSNYNESINNQKVSVIGDNEIDRIQCPKCNHEFYVNISHIASGNKYNLKCPNCDLAMIKKKIREMDVIESSNSLEKDQESVALQVLGLHALHEQYNMNMVLQEQDLRNLQLFQEQQVREQQQFQEQQVMEQQQFQEQQQIMQQQEQQQQLQIQQSHDNFNTFGNFDNQVDLGSSFGSGFNDFNMF